MAKARPRQSQGKGIGEDRTISVLDSLRLIKFPLSLFCIMQKVGRNTLLLIIIKSIVGPNCHPTSGFMKRGRNRSNTTYKFTS